MGIFSSIFSSNASGQPSSKDEIFFLRGSATFGVEVVEGDHYQTVFEAICGPRVPSGIHRLVTAVLVLDDKNRQDRNAVRVEVQGKPVGHLRRETGILYRQQLQARGTPKAIGRCQAVITGGWLSSDGRKGDYEVALDIASLSSAA